MDHPAVKLWRDRFHLNLSASWKQDVEKTVTDLDLWKTILDGWFYFDAKGKKRTKHPGIKNLLTEYERQKLNQQLQASNQRNNEASALSARSGEGVSEWGHGALREVWRDPPSEYFRTSDLVCRRHSKV